ncbi:hypothetical protein [Sinanaerobacter chloroacetimidivorans]|jgi:hypothetical protein|uniref:Uncharacterized protein n=1 Tax=Sinanaerobacter chloroacetimidivorans TaxID=2818044 RepID=A0A8J8B3D6_9FIRM|nr:hypothetical protein [Sinanaerobacter chloroacetimidivorans]MBR0599681.1 hypothetical protein [Sinanaerobacter chloroacetimidivorans]
MSDYLAALKIFVTNFRGSEYLLKSKKNYYYDEALEEGIHRVNSFYLPLWVLLGGFALFGWIGKQLTDSLDVLSGIIFLWLILDGLIVTPVLYLYFLPRPIGEHIKKVEMTESKIPISTCRHKGDND